MCKTGQADWPVNNVTYNVNVSRKVNPLAICPVTRVKALKAHKESVCVQWYRDVSVSGTELSWSGPCSRGSNVTPWRRHQSSTDGHPRSSESLTPELGEGRRRRTAAFCCGANFFFSPRLSAFVAEVTRSRFIWERFFLYSFKGVFSVFFLVN